uniref:Uncharacterized protein n=1 Tax=Tanacetum cinerariifolium TaxID=118510 RepID=A0A6L2LYU5_TANCI|nr:hypothetical protein [Tanacetum cinerariifolium]
MHESKSFNKHPTNKTMYHALMESLIADEDAMDQRVADLIKHKKRLHDNEDRDQDPPAGSDQGLKKIKTSDDAQLSKNPKSMGSSKDTTRSQPKSISKSVQSEEIVFEATYTEMPLNQGHLLMMWNGSKNITWKNAIDQLDWNNPDGNRCPYDLSKPLPLQESQGRLTIPADFFFNNDLEYLRGGSTDIKYTTSKKIKAAKYDVEGTEDMVPNL